jgi:hypothetical protein
MTLADQFDVIIKRQEEAIPIKEVANLFIDKTVQNSEIGLDPTDKAYEPYDPSTIRKKGRSNVDMRDKSRSIETLYQFGQGDSVELKFAGNAGAGSSSRPSGEVFYMHQYGQARGGKIRQTFFEDRDTTSAGFQEVNLKVEKLLTEHFNDK